MKVLLVATNRERSPYPVAPLGALCVAGAARAAGHEVEFLDLGTTLMPHLALCSALARNDFQAVAFGIRNLDNCWYFAPRSYFDEVRELAEIVRRHFRGPLILGGTGFSVSPRGWIERLDANCGVVGEGEQTFVEVLSRLELGWSLEGIAGVVFPQKQAAASGSSQEPYDDATPSRPHPGPLRMNGFPPQDPHPPCGHLLPLPRAKDERPRERETPFPRIGDIPHRVHGPNVQPNLGVQSPAIPAKAIEELRELSLPAHDLCRYSRYQRRGGFVGIQTKRGCPFKCSYCIYPQLEGRRYRLRPPETVALEVEAVASNFKLRHFFFVDSVFNDPRSHALAICRELARRKLPARWSAFCNPVGFDAELARAMATAGCEGVEFGLDVASEKMLAALDKPFGQAEIRTALKAAHDAGLPLAVFLLFGGPTETWKDVEDTQKFLNDCAPANAVFATLGIRVFENTPIAATAVRDGQLAPGQDLFAPAYYLSADMAEDSEKKLDRIARRREEWTSPVDWRRFVTRCGQKVTVMLNVRPQWKNLRSYGRHMRKQEA